MKAPMNPVAAPGARYLTIAQAANRGPFGRSKLYDLMKDGKIEAIKIGKATRILTASLDAYADAQRRYGQ